MPIWILIAYGAVSAFCIFGAVRLFSTGRPAYAKAVLTTYVAYSSALALLWIFRISVPSYLLLLTMLTVWGSCFFGHYLQWYDRSRVFDRYLHGFGTFSFALFSYCVLDDFIVPGGARVYQALFVTLLGNTLGVLFELIEMLHDSKRRMPKAQKGLVDTDMDQLCNLIGSILAGGFAYFFLMG